MTIRSALLLIALALSLQSCFFSRSTTNEPLDPAKFRSLTAGASAADCVRLLGAPSDVVQLGRRFAYRYDHAVSRSAGVLALLVGIVNHDAREDRAWLFFDDKGVLTHVGTTFSAHRPQWAFPFEDVHEESDRASADQGREGLSEGGR